MKWMIHPWGVEIVPRDFKGQAILDLFNWFIDLTSSNAADAGSIASKRSNGTIQALHIITNKTEYR